MASNVNVSAYSDALVILGTAGILVPLVRRFGINPVVAYIGAGALLGPSGLGSLISQFPVLYWFTVVDAQNVAGIADLGIVFLLFIIGLELSFQRLMAMRRLVMGLGLAQVLAATAAISGIGVIFGLSIPVATVLGATLSLSSTAIVLELLSREGRMGTHTGRACFSVLLAQDLAVIPILMYVSLLGGQGDGSVLESVAKALLQGAVALVAIGVLGRVLLRPMFRLVAATKSSELFIATVLFVIVASGLLAYQAGLSMALGAFVAGLLLAETEFGKKIEVTIDPFKGLLLGIFFFTVGMNIDFAALVKNPLLVGGAVVGLILVKTGILYVLARAFRLPVATATESALLLAPGSEFAFVGIGLAAASQVLPLRLASLALGSIAITMALTPLLAKLGQRIASRTASVPPQDPELLVRPTADGEKALVVGYGRVGKRVCSLLSEHHVPFIAIDHNVSIVSSERQRGQHGVFYGDASDEAFLAACGLSTATGLIITMDAHDKVGEIVRTVRNVRPDLMIVARARDAEHARSLYAVGATTAVPETIEASFQLSEAALIGLGVATGLTIASIHEHRDRVRESLKKAAERGSLSESEQV